MKVVNFLQYRSSVLTLVNIFISQRSTRINEEKKKGNLQDNHTFAIHSSFYITELTDLYVDEFCAK